MAREPGEVAPRGAERDRFAETFRNLTDALSALVRGHVELARVELVEDLRALGRDAAVGLAGIPLLLTGYILLWTAIGMLLARYMPGWAAFGIGAGINLLVGLALVTFAAKRARGNTPRMPESSVELRRDRAWLRSLKDEVRH